VFQGLHPLLQGIQALVHRGAVGHLGTETLSLAGVPVYLAAGGPRDTGQDATAKDHTKEH
jgi:hypothetical protein